MGWLQTWLQRRAASHEKYAFLTQSAFDGFAARQSRRNMTIGAVAAAVAGALLLVASALLSPRLIREGPLLWFGAEADARVIEWRLVEQSRTKSGEPRYRLDVSFEFATPNGARHTGKSTRTDIAVPVYVSPGQTIRIFYDPRDPSRSTIEHNLRVDVYALLLFLPFILLMASACFLYVFRWHKWTRRQR